MDEATDIGATAVAGAIITVGAGVADTITAGAIIVASIDFADFAGCGFRRSIAPTKACTGVGRSRRQARPVQFSGNTTPVSPAQSRRRF